MAGLTSRAASRVPAPALFVAGAVSMYVGAALAVGLFDRLSPTVVAVLRVVSAGLVLLVIVRPGREAWRWPAVRGAAAYGLATALMNIAFYEAIARLPLGTAVALELLTAAHGVASMLIAKPHLPWGDVEDFADRVLTAVCLGQITRGAIDRDAPGGPDRHPTERTTRCRARSITRSSRGCGP